ncbi:DapH/DapD/GlmU-related protein [Hymenobacter sp. DG01]|uniref:acyltransferase n=1 Tax=Hymenobacter sp. DG01 TaxID=2584940 RepID=UPI00111CC1D3|nr:acyltransferase [Hymenobacter sp. DG01]
MIGYFSEDELLSLGFASLGKNVRISKTSTLYNRGNIHLGDNVRIDNFCVLAPSSSAIFSIGDNVQISAYSFINGMGNVSLQNFVTLAPYVRIFSSTDDYSGRTMTGATLDSQYLGTKSAPVYVESHVIIGNGSTIMPGIHVGKGAAIGAYSFVNSDVPSFVIVAGVPARKIKERRRDLLGLEEKFLDEKSKG